MDNANGNKGRIRKLIERSTEIRIRFVGVSLLLFFVASGGLIAAYIWSDPKTFSQKNEFMKLVAQVATGFVLLSGLYLTYRSVRLSQRNIELTQDSVNNAGEQLRIDRDTKVAELFFKASEQISDSQNSHRRVSGIYTLGRISRQHPDYYQQCMDVIVTFVNHSHSLNLDIDFFGPNPNVFAFSGRSGKAPVDLQAAVDVLCTRGNHYSGGEEFPIDFFGVDFSHVRFRNGDFSASRFNYCSFEHSWLYKTRFNYSVFADCVFDEFHWDRPDFRNATFRNCRCDGINLDSDLGALPAFRVPKLFRIRSSKGNLWQRGLAEEQPVYRMSELLEGIEWADSSKMEQDFETLKSVVDGKEQDKIALT